MGPVYNRNLICFHQHFSTVFTVILLELFSSTFHMNAFPFLPVCSRQSQILDLHSEIQISLFFIKWVKHFFHIAFFIISQYLVIDSTTDLIFTWQKWYNIHELFPMHTVKMLLFFLHREICWVSKWRSFPLHTAEVQDKIPCFIIWGFILPSHWNTQIISDPVLNVNISRLLISKKGVSNAPGARDGHCILCSGNTEETSYYSM